MSIKEPMYIIEYRYKNHGVGGIPCDCRWSQWQRSKSVSAKGEYSYNEAWRIAEKNAKIMGLDYQYRVGDLKTIPEVNTAMSMSALKKTKENIMSEPLYIIEYRYKTTTWPSDVWSQWQRSKNVGASGEYSSYDVAQRIAEKNQAGMGVDFEYRVGTLRTGDIPNVQSYTKEATGDPSIRQLEKQQADQQWAGTKVEPLGKLGKSCKAEEMLIRIQAILNSKTKAEQIQDILNEELT